MGDICLRDHVKLSCGLTLSCYSFEGCASDYCEKMLEMHDIKKQMVELNIEGEEVEFSKTKHIGTVKELRECSNITSCTFRGVYRNNLLEILVLFQTKDINIVSASEVTAQEFIRDLQYKD